MLREQHDDETTVDECKRIAMELAPLDEEVTIHTFSL